MGDTSHANTARFRTLEVYASHDEGADFSQPLDDVLKIATSGYHAFYGHSAVMKRETSTTSELKDCFLAHLSGESSLVTIDPSLQADDWTPEAGKLYLPGDSLPKDYAEKTSRFLRQLREALAAGTGGFSAKPAFAQNLTSVFSRVNRLLNTGKPSPAFAIALNQASVFDLVGDRREKSPLIDATLGYHEYLLWDDGGLWGKENWHNQHDEVKKAYGSKSNTSPLDTWAEQRMAWVGAGWPNQSLARWCSILDEAWPELPEFSTMANAKLERLERYDLALAEYYRKTKTCDPPGYKPWNDYVRLLCNFLPDHRSRSDPNKWLGSNTLGDDGGPRRWRGILDDRLNMHLVHLLLDGWLILWPVEKDSHTRFYLQPGSLALLYWAAQLADMPWTNTPQNFLEHYDWSDPNWFGACREYWKPIR